MWLANPTGGRSRGETLALLLVGFATVLAACRRGPIAVAAPDVTISPPSLDFGRVALGSSLTLEVELQNRGPAAAPISVGVDAPFFLGAGAATAVPAGSAVKIGVVFAPRALGPRSGLTLGGGLPPAGLTGEGIASCVATGPCATSRFDLKTRTCVEEPFAEGSSCSAPCLSGPGTCRAGYCLGSAIGCVDGDRCTLDACGSDGGCLHPAVECPTRVLRESLTGERLQAAAAALAS